MLREGLFPSSVGDHVKGRRVGARKNGAKLFTPLRQNNNGGYLIDRSAPMSAVVDLGTDMFYCLFPELR